MFALNIPLVKGNFLRRPNRFVVYVEIDGVEYGASLPNPGKMEELLFPGVKMLLTPMDTDRVKYPYKVMGIESCGQWIMLDTLKNNDCAAWLVENGMIPSLAGYKLIRREVTVGKSRFDMLLEHEGEKVYCEVKSCSLFGGDLAMFPDAVTERGRRHVEELGELADKGVRTVVLFIVHSGNVSHFVPDFHTDPDFSEALYKNRNSISVIPFSLGWSDTLQVMPQLKELPVSWDLYERHGRDDSGLYLFLLHNEFQHSVEIGSLGEIDFQAGYYLYVGSAQVALSKRLARHSRKRKGMHWHIDYLRNETTVVSSWPIRNKDLKECDLAQRVSSIADAAVEHFGSSDCHCNSHLFYFSKNPAKSRELQELLLSVRMKEFVN